MASSNTASDSNMVIDEPTSSSVKNKGKDKDPEFLKIICRTIFAAKIDTALIPELNNNEKKAFIDKLFITDHAEHHHV